MATEDEARKVRAVGINHVALEVGDIDAALEFYGSFLDFELRGRSRDMAFLDLGDQFIALAVADEGHKDAERHFGLVVDDKAAARAALEAASIEIMPGKFLDLRDPWGNRVQIVDYTEIQFLKHADVLEAMGLADLGKSEDALAELRRKGIETTRPRVRA
jgi:catechol 2,3-dioxygenase-like lactoylglutathione lyase family enzyme